MTSSDEMNDAAWRALTSRPEFWEFLALERYGLERLGDAARGVRDQLQDESRPSPLNDLVICLGDGFSWEVEFAGDTTTHRLIHPEAKDPLFDCEIGFHGENGTLAVSDLVVLADRARVAPQRHLLGALAPLVILDVVLPNNERELDTMVEIAEAAWSASTFPPPAPVAAYRRWLEEWRRQFAETYPGECDLTTSLQEAMEEWEYPPPEAAILARLYDAPVVAPTVT